MRQFKGQSSRHGLANLRMVVLSAFNSSAAAELSRPAGSLNEVFNDLRLGAQRRDHPEHVSNGGVLGGDRRRHTPGGPLEQVRLCRLDTLGLARHRMPADEADGAGEQFLRPGEHLHFRRTGIGHDGATFQVWRDVREDFLGGANRGADDDDVRITDRLAELPFGAIDGTDNEDYVEAVAVLVALGDWMSTRSHVFTIYGTLRGSGPKSAADQTAIRFQETVDRMPCMFNGKLPQRIGQRIVSGYSDARGD